VKIPNSKEVIIYDYVIIFILHLCQLTITRLAESPGQSREGFKCPMLQQKSNYFPVAILY